MTVRAAWARAALLAALALATVALLPRVPAKEPFDRTWLRRVGEEHARVVVLGNCLASQFDERLLATLLGGRVLRISEGGTFSREWYLLLRHSVFPVPEPPALVVVPFVGDELDVDAGASDAWARRRTDRWVPDDAPADPVYDAVVARSAPPLEPLRRALSRSVFRPAALSGPAMDALDGLVLRLFVPPSALPPPARAGDNVPNAGTDGTPLGRWRVGVLSRRLDHLHLRPGVSFEPPASAAGLAPRERLERTFVPAILDLADAHGARIVFARAAGNAGDPPELAAFLDHAAAYVAGRGHLWVDVSADAPPEAERLADPFGAAATFTRRFAERARVALR